MSPEEYRHLRDALSEGIGAGISNLGTLVSTRSGPAAAKAGVSAIGGVAEGGAAIAFGAGPAGMAAAAAIKLGTALAHTAVDITQWGEQLHATNMQFAEFSGAMATVEARQQVRDINLSRIRGDKRAEMAEGLAEQRHSVNVGLARIVDEKIDPMKNQFMGGLYNATEKIVNPEENKRRTMQEAIDRKREMAKNPNTIYEETPERQNDWGDVLLMGVGLSPLARLRANRQRKAATTRKTGADAAKEAEALEKELEEHDKKNPENAEAMGRWGRAQGWLEEASGAKNWEEKWGRPMRYRVVDGKLDEGR